MAPIAQPKPVESPNRHKNNASVSGNQGMLVRMHEVKLLE